MFLGKCLVIVGFLFLNTANAEKHGTIITDVPNLGKLKGTSESTTIGVNFYSYMGIPFAEPPVNELRLEPPVSKKPWNGVWDSTYERGCCYQMTNDRSEESEDCLYLNVYTPTKTFNESLPVMFFIYGGGFIEGYSERVNYGPEHLMEHGVIFVTSNYRVGPFGFFSTGDKVIPGNLGLKDQWLALKWINEHISSFGGDPTKITIFGQSAGSASTMYHLLSPKSKGLFSGAIGESASALSPWAYQNHLPEVSHYLAASLNPEFKKNKPSSEELLKFMKSVPAKEIDKASYTLDLEYDLRADYIQIEQGFFFTPTIEPEHDGAFLTNSMYDSFKNGNFNRVPTILGVNTEECFFYHDNATQIKAFTYGFDKDITDLIPLGLNITDKQELLLLAKQIKKFYLPEGTFSANNRSLIRYLSDQGFARSIIKQAQLQSKYSPVYLYEFAFHGVLGGYVSESVPGFSQDVRHGEEMNFIITRSYGGLNTTDLTKYPKVDQTVQQRMITFFTNFAKYRDPTPKKEPLFQNLKWPKVEAGDIQYMDVGSELEIKKNPKNEMFQFWENIFKKYEKNLITY